MIVIEKSRIWDRRTMKTALGMIKNYICATERAWKLTRIEEPNRISY